MKRVLALSAHPDDVEIGAGAFLRRIRPEVAVSLVAAPGDRMSEAVDAWGKVTPHSHGPALGLGLPDGRVSYLMDDLKASLEHRRGELVDTFAGEPSLILAPRLDDAHPDHRAVAEVALTVWRHTPILRYEVPKYVDDLGPAPILAPMTVDEMEWKVAMLHSAYGSQRGREWWTDGETFRALARLRGIQARARYAEGFISEKWWLEV